MLARYTYNKKAVELADQRSRLMPLHITWEKLGRLAFQISGDQVKLFHCDVGLPAFNSSHIAPIKPARDRESILRDAGFESLIADRLPEFFR